LLVGLDADQRAAVEVEEGPLLIVAGPGTGKTRTLTHRIAYRVARGTAPESCLAITFTRRAAEEMGERLAQLLPAAGGRVTVTTFHALGLDILRREHAELGLDRAFRVADEAAQRSVLAACLGISGSEVERRLKALSAARRRRDLGELAGELEAYRQALWARELVDFDDLLALPVALLESRPDLRRAYRRRFRFVSIDEYQDVDALQYRLVRLLVPADGDVSAIGDPDQSIYRFRGADVGFFLRFRRDFPAARVVELGRNYRSQQTILRAACQAIAPASLVPERRLEAVVEAGEPVVVHAAADARGEAEYVVRTIEELVGGTSYYAVDSGRVRHELAARETALSFADFAVLYRTRAQAAAFADALERAGLPYQARSHDPLLGRDEVRLLVQGMNARAEGAARRESVRRLLDDARRDCAGAVEAERLEAAVELLAPLAEAHGDDLDAFCHRLALGAEVDAWDPRAERVSLLTLHAAKGLEFPVVFLAGCDDGLLPLTWAGDDLDPAEERRLFFVGMTRARQRLYLTRARRRRWRGEARETRPSPFLAAIDKSLLHHRRAAPRRRPAARQLRLL